MEDRELEREWENEEVDGLSLRPRDCISSINDGRGVPAMTGDEVRDEEPMSEEAAGAHHGKGENEVIYTKEVGDSSERDGAICGDARS